VEEARRGRRLSRQAEASRVSLLDLDGFTAVKRTDRPRRGDLVPPRLAQAVRAVVAPAQDGRAGAATEFSVLWRTRGRQEIIELASGWKASSREGRSEVGERTSALTTRRRARLADGPQRAGNVVVRRNADRGHAGGGQRQRREPG